MRLSIIIPTLNEAAGISSLFLRLKELPSDTEVIVVDGGSNDDTQEIARSFNFKLLVTDPGRAKQLTYGAQSAKGDTLLFLHADVHLGASHLSELRTAQDKGTQLASFPIEFDLNHWFLNLNAIFSRLAHPFFHFGDQALWISRTLYDQCGGYDPNMEILEDQDIYQRASKIIRPVKFKTILEVSARKYRQYGAIILQLHYYKLWLMWKLGFVSRKIAKKNRDFLSARKLSDT